MPREFSVSESMPQALFLLFHRSYLRDVIDTANIYLKMMQKFCQGKVVVQKKKKSAHSRSNKPKPKQSFKKPSHNKSPEERQEELENNWDDIVNSLSVVLGNEINVPEEERPIPFDATSDTEIDDQK